MTHEQTQTLKVGDRVCWNHDLKDLGTVVKVSESYIEIKWENGVCGGIHPRDMACVSLV